MWCCFCFIEEKSKNESQNVTCAHAGTAYNQNEQKYCDLRDVCTSQDCMKKFPKIFNTFIFCFCAPLYFDLH